MLKQTKGAKTFVILQCLVVIIVTEILGTYGVNIRAQHKIVKRQINDTGLSISTNFEAPTKLFSATEPTKDWRQKEVSKKSWKAMPSGFSRRKDELPSFSRTTAAMPQNPTKPSQKVKTKASSDFQVETTWSKTANAIQGTGRSNKPSQNEMIGKSTMMRTLQHKETDPMPTKFGQTVTKQESLSQVLEQWPFKPLYEKAIKQHMSTKNEVQTDPTTNSNMPSESKMQSSDGMATNRSPNLYPTKNVATIVPKAILTEGATLDQKSNQPASSGPPGLGADLIQDHLDTMQDMYHNQMEALLKHSQSTYRHVTTVSNTKNGQRFAGPLVDFHNTAMNRKDTSFPQMHGHIVRSTNEAQHHPNTATSLFAQQTHADKHLSDTATDQLADASIKSQTTQPTTAENNFNTKAGIPAFHMPEMAFFEHMSGTTGVNKTRIHVLTTKETKEMKISPHNVETNITTPTPEDEEEEEGEKPKETSSQESEMKVEPTGTLSSFTLLSDGFTIHSVYEDIKPSLAYGIDGGINMQQIGSNGPYITSTGVTWADVKSEMSSFNATILLSIIELSDSFSKNSITDSISMEAVETNILPASSMSQIVSVTPTMFVFEDTVGIGSESEETSGSLSTSTLHPSQSFSTDNTLKTLMHKSTKKIEKDDIKPTTSFSHVLTRKIQIQTFEKEQIKPTKINKIHVSSSVNINTIDATSDKYGISTNQSSANKQGETTKAAPIENNMTVSATFGIVAGCLIAFWIIIGPIICLLLKVSDKKKEKNRKLRAEMNRDSKENCIMEAMIMSELGRDVPSMNSSKYFTNGTKTKTNCNYSVLAKDRNELEKLKSDDKTCEVMLP